MIVAGTVNYKMASRVRRLYNQMPDPSSDRDGAPAPAAAGPITSVITSKGVDLVVPVTLRARLPPRPERRWKG